MAGFMEGLLIGKEAVLNLVASACQKVGAFLPNFLGSLVILLVGWIIALITKQIAKRIFRLIGINYIAESSGVNQLLKKVGVQKRAEDFLASLVYLSILLIFIVSATEVLGITIVIDTLNQFIAYLPKIFGALFIFIFISYLGKVTKQIVLNFLSSYKIEFSSILATFLEVIITVFALIIALRELGFPTTIFTANITVILALMFFAVAIALGLGGKRVAENLIAGLYLKKLFSINQEIELDEIKGKIKGFFPTSVLIEAEAENFFVPNKEVLEKAVKVKHN